MVKKRPPALKPLTLKSFFIFFCETAWLFLLIIPSVAVAMTKTLFKRQKDLKGKVVLVTGAGNGLGKEMALQLSQQGCIVLCVDIKEGDNEKTLREIKKVGAGKAYTCDVSDVGQVKALSETILDEFGRVDVLINNAGIVFGGGILTGTDEQISRVSNVNFLSNLWMIRAFLPSMISNEEGHIVCISSLSAIHALGYAGVYSCTKFAVLGLVYSMLDEFRDNNLLGKIKISCALPYFISTNKHYSDQWRLRVPPLTTERAAKLIIEGFRKEFMFYTVPWTAFGYNLSSSFRILPMKVYHFIREKCYAEFILDDQFDKRESPKH